MQRLNLELTNQIIIKAVCIDKENSHSDDTRRSSSTYLFVGAIEIGPWAHIQTIDGRLENILQTFINFMMIGHGLQGYCLEYLQESFEILSLYLDHGRIKAVMFDTGIHQLSRLTKGEAEAIPQTSLGIRGFQSVGCRDAGDDEITLRKALVGRQEKRRGCPLGGASGVSEEECKFGE